MLELQGRWPGVEATDPGAEQLGPGGAQPLQCRQPLRPHRQQIAEAGEAGEPGLQLHAGRRCDRLQIQPQRAAGRLGEHHRRAGQAAHADVLGAVGQPFPRQLRQQRQLAAQPLRLGRGSRIPERVVAVEAAGGVHQQHAVIARHSGAGREHRPLGHPQHRHRQGVVGTLQVGVAAHHRHPEHFRSPAQARQQRLRPLGIPTPDAVHHRQRPAAHRRDVAEVHQHGAPAREPGVLLHQRRRHPLAGQQQAAGLGGQQGGIVAQGRRGPEGGEGLVGEGGRRRLDVALAQQARLPPQPVRQLVQGAHAASGWGRRSRAGW